MDAAETGHLVFTTLHANSAASSLTRLMDMEVPSYKLNASLRGVLAQRLLRRVCQNAVLKDQLTMQKVFSLAQRELLLALPLLSAEENKNAKRKEFMYKMRR